MKVLTKEEEDAHYREVLRGGISGGLVGLGVGLGASMVMQRRWPLFRSLTLPLKAFFVTSTGTFAAIIQADTYSRAYERQQHATTAFVDRTARKLQDERARQTATQRALAVARDYRYTLVTSSWAASMAGSLYWVSRDRYLTTAQKLVQARMYAQGLTLLVLVATAAFEVGDGRARRQQADDAAAAGEAVPDQPVHHHSEQYQGQDLWKGLLFPLSLPPLPIFRSSVEVLMVVDGEKRYG